MFVPLHGKTYNSKKNKFFGRACNWGIRDETEMEKWFPYILFWRWFSLVFCICLSHFDGERSHVPLEMAGQKRISLGRRWNDGNDGQDCRNYYKMGFFQVSEMLLFVQINWRCEGGSEETKRCSCAKWSTLESILPSFFCRCSDVLPVILWNSCYDSNPICLSLHAKSLHISWDLYLKYHFNWTPIFISCEIQQHCLATRCN